MNRQYPYLGYHSHVIKNVFFETYIWFTKANTGVIIKTTNYNPSVSIECDDWAEGKFQVVSDYLNYFDCG